MMSRHSGTFTLMLYLCDILLLLLRYHTFVRLVFHVLKGYIFNVYTSVAGGIFC
jgi:hypothetical protein